MEQIKKTNNYSLFSFLDGNRIVTKKNTLVKSIRKIDLTMYKPILVDGEYRIIDGQHRYLACVELNKPIYYMIVKNKDVKMALIALNAHQKMWRQEEYLSFFDANNGGSYSELKRFMEKHKMPISNAMVVFPKGQINASYIKSGNLDVEINEQCDKIAYFLSSENIRNLNFSKTRSFVLAIRKGFDEYSEKQMEKIKKNCLKIPQCANYNQYLVVFKNILKC